MTKKQTSYYIHSLICIAIMFGVGFLSPFGAITEYGMKVLGIFLGAVYGWVFVGFIWPSFLGMLMLAYVGYGTTQAVFSQGFGDAQVVISIILCFVLFDYLEKSGLINFMGNRLLALKINVGRPWILAAVILGFSAIGGAINSFAIIILLWSLFGKICDNVGSTKENKYQTFIMTGIACFSLLAIAMFPFLPFPLAMIGLMSAGAGMALTNTTGWMILGPVICFVAIAIYILVGKYVFKIDGSLFANATTEYANAPKRKMTKQETVALAYLLIFIAIIVLPSFLPAAWKVTVVMKDWGVIGACAICFIGMAFPINENGVQKVSFTKLFAAVNWEMLILVIATMPICAAMESNDAGIVSTVVGFVAPIFQTAGPTVFLLCVAVVIGLITQLVHNLILLLVFASTLGSLCVTLGINPMLCAFLFMMALQTAAGSPGGSAQSAMIFSNDRIAKGPTYVYTWLFVITVLVLLVIIGIPVGGMLF